VSDLNDIESMLQHYNGWPVGYVAQHPEALNLAKSIARMVDGKPWRLGADSDAGPVPTGLTGKPELVYDPGTDRYGIIVDNCEVISGLDPVGMREAIAAAAQAPAVADAPESEPSVDVEVPQ